MAYLDVACLTGIVWHALMLHESLFVWHGTGAMYSRYGKAEVGSPLMEHSQEELADCEGLVVRVRGDGQVYCIVLTTGVCTLSHHSAACDIPSLAHGVILLETSLLKQAFCSCIGCCHV